jgi:hypothetical protein
MTEVFPDPASPRNATDVCCCMAVQYTKQNADLVGTEAVYIDPRCFFSLHLSTHNRFHRSINTHSLQPHTHGDVANNVAGDGCPPRRNRDLHTHQTRRASECDSMYRSSGDTGGAGTPLMRNSSSSCDARISAAARASPAAASSFLMTESARTAIRALTALLAGPMDMWVCGVCGL